MRKVRVPPRPRDTKRKRVYDSENVLYGPLGFNDFKTLDEIQEFVDDTVSTRWWKNRYPHVTHVSVNPFSQGKGGMGFTPRTGSTGARIRIGKGGFYIPLVLHELAHTISPRDQAWHGQEFCRNYIYLIRRFMDEKSAKRLTKEFDKRNIRWRRYKISK